MSDLTDAIKDGDIDEVGRILDREPSRINDAESGVPLTLFALYVSQPAIAELFVTRGRKLTFHEACALGRLEQVESMLHADPELLDQRSPDGFLSPSPEGEGCRAKRGGVRAKPILTKRDRSRVIPAAAARDDAQCAASTS